MQQDDMIWTCMKNGFCSFKYQTKTQIMCKNENNVTGLCHKSGCPLANSNYATVREHMGKIYLCKKVVERAAFPNKLWEKIKLPENYEEALAEIDVILPYWNQKQVHRCKQRYTKIYQYLERARKQVKKMRAKKLITLPRKMERREKAREKKALIAAKLETNIEAEIMNRVKLGVYGEKYQFKDKEVFEKALVDQHEEEILAQPSTSKSKPKQAKVKLSNKYVPDIEDLGESDIEGEFVESEGDGFWDTEDEEEKLQEAQSNYIQKKKKKQTVTVEWD